MAAADRYHGNWACIVARSGNLKLSIIGELGAQRGEVAAYPRSVEFEQQSFDLGPSGHGVFSCRSAIRS
jgi:hypothetical protein